MDISQIMSVSEREDRGTVVHVRDAVGELQYQEADPTRPVTITVAGTFSKRYQDTLAGHRDALFKQRRATLSGEQLTQQQIELVAACIISWDGFTLNGAPFPCTMENAVMVLKSAHWIRQELEEAMGDHASFFTSSST